jgi:methylenetetrahydrofolate dehydrogenase (NADP+)/methenyltetrahydrofolate cyclohydrolase
MKILSGTELAGFIKERQAKQVRALRQAEKIVPKLTIIQTTDNPVIATYVRMKQRYGEDILVDVEVVKPENNQLMTVIDELNNDQSVHGIIIQLPLDDMSQTEDAVNRVVPEKDVDGLGKHAILTPATPMAIDWLLAGYNVELSGKTIAIVGNGRLVGAPLAKMWRDSGKTVSVYDNSTEEMSEKLKQADVIVSAVGVAGLIKSESVKHGAVVVDAAASAEDGKIVGDIAGDMRARDDLTITPEKGGVGPLTVCALFDNVVRAARSSAK